MALHGCLQMLERRPVVAALMLEQPQVVMTSSVAGFCRQDRRILLTSLADLTLLMQSQGCGQEAAVL